MSRALAKPNRANVFGAKSHSTFLLFRFIWLFGVFSTILYYIYIYIFFFLWLAQYPSFLARFKFDFVIYFNPTLAQISFHNLVFAVSPLRDLGIVVGKVLSQTRELIYLGGN